MQRTVTTIRMYQALAMSDPHKIDNYLAVTALGDNSTGLVRELARIIKDCNCSIGESRMTVMGNRICILMLVSGTWNAVAKTEDVLVREKDRLGIDLNLRRTSMQHQGKNLMPYAIDVVAIDQPGIVHNIVNFFNQNEIDIRDIQTNTYKTASSGSVMFSMHMIINIPADLSIASVRGEFMDFCDQYNLDSIMEPVK